MDVKSRSMKERLSLPTEVATLTFEEFIDVFNKDPEGCMMTSHQLVHEAVKSFGFDLVIRRGEPAISYRLFEDPFAEGINAVYGQEHCIKLVADVIESVGREAGPPRGIVLVGPPSSGKTNIADLLAYALEEYTRQNNVQTYSFYFVFPGDDGEEVYLRNCFNLNPAVILTTFLGSENTNALETLRKIHGDDGKKKINIPPYFHRASLDKVSLDIIEALMRNPKHKDMNLFDILNKYIRVERTPLSCAQAIGVSNIDNMALLQTKVRTELPKQLVEAVENHAPGVRLKYYEGAIVSSNRGILHIHDAFTCTGKDSIDEREYKPLLMLFGSGRVSIESTQTAIDNVVMLTTNLEEMALLEGHLTASKLLDRIEKVPVNYLLDFNSELKIIERDLKPLLERYDVDPSLLPLAAYFAVLTRLLPPMDIPGWAQDEWDDKKKEFYRNLTPEQKLFLYAFSFDDPVKATKKLPLFHPFRNEAKRVGIDPEDPESLRRHFKNDGPALKLENTGVFQIGELRYIDESLIRALWQEHYPNEGKFGISVRQIQNIMRDTISSSDGLYIFARDFIEQVLHIVTQEGEDYNHWLKLDETVEEMIDNHKVRARNIGVVELGRGECGYCEYEKIPHLLKALWYMDIVRHITIATVDRDPSRIESDLRQYVQNCLLYMAKKNTRFGHRLVSKFSFIDVKSGEEIDRPQLKFMKAIETVLVTADDNISKAVGDEVFDQAGNVKALSGNTPNFDEWCDSRRIHIAEKFLDLQKDEEIILEEGKNVMFSSNDGFIQHFWAEYSVLLSNRRTDGKINPSELEKVFFIIKNNPKDETVSEQTMEFAKKIIVNLNKRFNYSEKIAIDTVTFALTNGIFEFQNIVK